MMTKRGFSLLLLLLFSPLLSAQQPKAFTEAVAVPRAILEEAAYGFETTDFEVHYVDSQGLFRDFFARLALGGEETDRLRARLKAMARGDGGHLLVYSPNPGLAYTVLKHALPEEDQGDFDLEGIILGYAGQERYGDRLCDQICDRQGTFVFIDTRKGMTQEPERTPPGGSE